MKWAELKKKKKNIGEKMQIFDSKGFCFSLAGQMIGNCVVVHVFSIASSGLSVRPSQSRCHILSRLSQADSLDALAPHVLYSAAEAVADPSSAPLGFLPLRNSGLSSLSLSSKVNFESGPAPEVLSPDLKAAALAESDSPVLFLNFAWVLFTRFS